MANFDQLIEQLKQAIDPKHRDEYGPDPFHFRKLKENPINKKISLAELLSQFDEGKLPIETSNQTPEKLAGTPCAS